MGLKSYSSTATENVDVSGVAGTEIDENDNPAALNNATRQIMADLATDLISGSNFVWELQGVGTLVRVGLDATFDGVTGTFNMTSLGDGTPINVSFATQIRVYIGGARQEPDVHYGVSGAAITFFTPPLSSDEFFALASTGETVTPVADEYLLFEDDYEHMFAQSDPDYTGTGEQEIDLGLHLLEVNTP
jgi:hypothetical protein